ncbi:MAG TPA: tetratricopeptide repeat protein [Saprospiraceae bacterium]|nr:tetratricopeptide repeat protein [Saprospiraceae bacterium]MCB9269859.1 tetratricopeptide repeat protein [Lewinellaceae bacterium]HPG08928.1 tetratricopeptide repeat protein [Saprospiraceae bacterium]HPR01921.1 tetratricopeptide repeat protein [Saprospiraceae bacterium]HQU51478.1 tetratricopeptide repeat protein [Saprospiraceae bacterium]
MTPFRSKPINYYVSIGVALAAIIILYFGFDIKPSTQRVVEQSRLNQFESTNINALFDEALPKLDESSRIYLQNLERSLQPEDSLNAETYKELSSAWFDHQNYAIAGYYAQKVADIEATAEAWGITGSTYSYGLRNEDPKIRDFCANRALDAFEQAISLNPDEVSYRINQALVYTEVPPQDNPMKGILALRELEQKNPDNVAILSALGKLAVKTGQYERAKQRFERVLELNPDAPGINCLLVDVYKNLGDADRAAQAQQKCN